MAPSTVAALTASWPCRAARENADSGQYELCGEACTLTLTSHTVSIALQHEQQQQQPLSGNAQTTNLLHFPLSSVLFGTAKDKLLIVPSNRGPAWAIEMEVHAGGEALGVLRTLGCKVTGPEDHTPSLISELEIESILCSPGFNRFLENVEEQVARMQRRDVDSFEVGLL